MATDSLLDTAASKSLLDPSAPSAPVYIMRHGRTALDIEHRSDGWLDLPLSDEGQLELIESQQYLKTAPIVCIYGSDLQRVQETAKIVKSGLLSDPKIETVAAMKTWNLGVLAGTKKEHGRPKVKLLMQTPHVAPLGGESYDDFKARFLPWFEKTANKAVKSGKPILMVLSGSSLRLLGQEMFGNIDACDLDEGGLATCEYNGGSWSVNVVLGGEDASEYES